MEVLFLLKLCGAVLANLLELLELKEDLCVVMNNTHSRMDKKMSDMVDGLIVLEETLEDLRKKLSQRLIAPLEQANSTEQHDLPEGGKLRLLLENKVKENKEEKEEEDYDDVKDWEWAIHRRKTGGVCQIFYDRGDIDNVEFVINPNNPEKTEPVYASSNKKESHSSPERSNIKARAAVAQVGQYDVTDAQNALGESCAATNMDSDDAEVENLTLNFSFDSQSLDLQLRNIDDTNDFMASVDDVINRTQIPHNNTFLADLVWGIQSILILKQTENYLKES